MEEKKTFWALVRSNKQTPISFRQIQDIAGTDNRMVFYDDLSEKFTDHQLFGSKRKCFLMVTLHAAGGGASTKVNHWTLLWKSKSGINFFDPLGNDARRLINHVLHEPHRGLIDFCERYNVKQNTHKYQRDAADVQDCGSWCAFRAIFSQMSHKEFETLVESAHMEKDKLVSTLTLLPIFSGRK